MAHYYNAQGELVPEGTPGGWPSPTTILDIIAKPELLAYRQRVGDALADELMTKAQERGTRVHHACEIWLEDFDEATAVAHAKLQDDEPQYLRGFINWWNKVQPELVDCEIFLESKKYGYRGRCDLVVRINGELWIIDIKTGAFRWSHGYQLRSYEQGFFESTGEHARMGVLGLTTKTKQGYHRLKETKTPLINWVALKIVFDDYKKAHPVKLVQKGENVWKEDEDLEKPF